MQGMIVTSSFGQCYRLHMPGDAAVPDVLNPQAFWDLEYTQSFLNDLKVSDEHWRDILYRAGSGLARPAITHSEILRTLSRLLIDGRIKLYPVQQLSRQDVDQPIPKIEGEGGAKHVFAHASILLAHQPHDVTRFSNERDAEAFLQQVSLSDDQHKAVAQSLQLSGNAEQAKSRSDLVAAMGRGEVVVLTERTFAAPPPKGAGDAPATTKSANLGPHANGPSAAPASTDSSNKNQPVTNKDSTGEQPENKCTKEGEPISMTSGEELLSLQDFALPGPIPFIWTRSYRTSQSYRDTGIGYGWTHPGIATLSLHSDIIELTTEDGRTVRFARPYLGRKSQQLHEGMTLEYQNNDRMVLTQAGQPDKVFTQYKPDQFRLTQYRHKAYRLLDDGERGFALNFIYDQQGQLIQARGNWGKGLQFERNAQRRITAIYQTSTSGEKLQPALAQYDYNEFGDLTAHRNANGQGEQYAYDNHVIMQRTLPTGYAFYFEWDQKNPQAKCLRQWGDKGHYAYSFEWDPDNERSVAINSRGHRTEYRYNKFGLITEKIDPEGNVHAMHYNDAGQVITRIDPLGNITEYLYDEQQHLLRVTDALNQRTKYVYENDELTTITDAAGQHWKRKLNTLGLVEQITDPAGNTTKYEYNHQGLVSRVIDPAGRVRSLSWNARAELVREIDPLNNTLHYAYDDHGHLVQVIAQAAGQSLDHAKQSATHYAYTPTGLLSSVTTAEGQVTWFEYNANGQLSKHTDPHGRITQYRYDDGLSQPTQRIDPAGQVLQYEYDSERNLTALINENGDKYQFFYDGNERLIKEIGFDGRVQHYKYNAAGQLIQHLDSGEVITEFERDALGRLLTKSSRRVGTEPDANNERARYRYDALGRLVETYNEHQYLNFEYDSRGNLLKETQCDVNEARVRLLKTEAVIDHAYNPLGQRTQTQLSDGQRLTYDYDASLAFRSVSINNQMVTMVQRDSLGRELTRQQGALTTQSDYDPQGRLIKQLVSAQEGKYSPIQREYGYDAQGNLNYFNDGAQEIKYVYDNLNRLKLAASGQPEFFDFDPAGNLLSISSRPATSPGLVKGNRLLLQGDRKFDYDARGNLIRETRGHEGKLQRKFTYNLTNQLVAVESHNRHQTIRYKYDPLGRRIEKQDAFGKTRFVWTDNLLAQEIRDQIKKTYVYEPGSFKPLAMVQDNQVYYYHLDHLGTPRELTNDNGKIVWKARYKTYGNVALKEVEEVENNLRFQGQYYDEETGLHYNRFRYYHPGTGQFINQDPIGLLGGMNNYQYVPNPTAWVDPLGLSCKEGYAIIRQYDNGRREGHFTVEIVHGDKNYMSHQVITADNESQTTIRRAGTYAEGKTPVHEAIIKLPDAEAAYEYQKKMINTELGPYDAFNNSCLSYVCDVVQAGGGPTVGRNKVGYGRFLAKQGFGALR